MQGLPDGGGGGKGRVRRRGRGYDARMSQTPTPTIGRILQYLDHQGKIVPAIVTGVNADGTVDLHVFPTNVMQVKEISASAESGAGGWRWPPRM